MDSTPNPLDTPEGEPPPDRRAETKLFVERIKARCDEYLRALEYDLVLDVRVRTGLEKLGSERVPLALASLHDALDAIPPVCSHDVGAPAVPNERAEPPAVAMSVPSPVPTVPPPTRVIVQEMTARPVVASPHREPESSESPESPSALFDEFKAVDFESMSRELFRAAAAEYAARARALQTPAGHDAGDIAGRIVRKLTALSSQHNVMDVFGLKRLHNGDWAARAARARAERERLAAAVERPAPGRTGATPSTRTAAPAPPEASDDENEADEMPDLPLVQQLAHAAGIVVFGGVVKSDKLARWKRLIGPQVEWLTTDASGNKAVTVLERRVAEGRVGAVVILESLIGHKHFEPIVAASRQSGVPLAFGAKAGKGSILQALRSIEGALAQRGGTGAHRAS